MPSKGNVAVPLADGFNEDEFDTLRAQLRDAGYQMHVIGARTGTELIGRNHRFPVKVDRAVADVRPGDYVGLAVLHAGPYGLEDVPGIDSFVTDFARFERPTLVFTPPPPDLEQACWAFVDQLERGISDSARSPALSRATAAVETDVEFPWSVL